MGNIKEQKLRSLKKQNIIGAIIGLLVLAIVLFATFTSMISIFGLYMIDSKVRDEYETISSSLESGRPAGDYIVTDADLGIIEEHGDNTCDLSSEGIVDILGIAEAAQEEVIEHHVNGEVHGINTDFLGKAKEGILTVYPDTDIRVITSGSEKRIKVDFAEFGRRISEAVQKASREGEVTPDVMTFPYWMDLVQPDGTHIICKAGFVVYLREIAVIALLGVNVVIVTIILLILLVVFLVKNLRRRKMMNEVFFMDEVTGEHNWMWFLKNAEDELKDRKNASNKYAVLDVVFVNYRNFCVCHSVKEGEEMLKLVYDGIEKHLDKKKEMAAHHSAAHFAVLMLYSDRDVLEERIRRMIGELEHVNEDHKFNFWVGVSRIAAESRKRTVVDIEREYNNAGAARASITGDDSAIAFFDEKMVEEQKWIDHISENQEKALENEEFLVYYQPKYDPRTSELKGAEALIRWMSPVHQMISPGRFIPLFEKNGFITKIDHYMLEHVARDQRKWLDEGKKCVPVSVNVSRAHFIEEDLAEQIRDIVDLAGTPHDLIEIELTESAFFDDKNALIRTIGKLKEYGFTVSMDDFGSGYSSLNSLKEMPLDVLKLDADFFRNDDGTGRGRIVVSEAISLAKKLNMHTVAEGVEEKDQVDFLADEGCDLIQGFYFAKPMPKEEFADRI